MLATLLTFTFLAIAALAMAVIAVSLAKGIAAAATLRQQLALCGDARSATVMHERTRARPVITARAIRRPVRPLALPAQSRQLEAA
jgi:hypothetical protein